jgi:hypothetical protein
VSHFGLAAAHAPAETNSARVDAAPETDGLVERLRAAVRSEAYEEVLEHLGAYNRRFEQLLGEASGDPEESRRLFAEARELLEWAKLSTATNRAHAQARLSRLTHASGYAPAKNGHAPTWRLQG